ncbi:hypothetical protein J2W26_001575 [Variovorax boronicumulans]|nr:hypothetical protein [Variovorax boronicumulans]
MTPSSRSGSLTLLSMAAMLLSTSVFAQDSAATLAERLARVMRLDQFVVQGAAAQHLANPKSAGSEEPTDKQRLDLLRCLEHADTSKVIQALASVAAQELSVGEMNVALAFYASSAGKKQMQRELVEAQRGYGYELAGASPSLSSDERERLERFRKTPASAKLEEIPLRLRETPDSRKAVYMGGDMVATNCLRHLGFPRD